MLRRAQWLSVAKIADCAKKIMEHFKTRILVEIVDTVADIPGHANSTDVTSGATTNDRVYLVRKGLRADNVEITVFHNAFHFQAGRLQPVEWRRKVETYAMLAFLGIYGRPPRGNSRRVKPDIYSWSCLKPHPQNFSACI